MTGSRTQIGPKLAGAKSNPVLTNKWYKKEWTIRKHGF